MKLSTTELKIFKKMAMNRRDRLGWAYIHVVIGFVGMYNILPHLPDGVSGSYFIGIMLISYPIITVALAHNHIRTEKKMIDVLHQYMDRDPETVIQRAGLSETDFGEVGNDGLLNRRTK